MASFNRWSIDNHRKASHQEPTPCVRVERGMVRVKCLAQAHNTMSRPGLEPGPFVLESSAVTMKPLRELNVTNLVRWINSLIEWKSRQTNPAKEWTYSLLIFLCGDAGPGKERNVVQATWRLFENRHYYVYSLILRYKFFWSFPVHLQIAFWNDFPLISLWFYLWIKKSALW